MRPQYEVLHALEHAGVRHVLVGIAGANCWARDGSLVASHGAHEIVLDPNPESLTAAWLALRTLGYTLREGTKRIPDPLPDGFARGVAEELRSTSAYRMSDRTLFDLHTAIPRFTFEELWREHRVFRAGEVDLHVARLRHILSSMHQRQARFDALAVATWSQGMHDHYVTNPDMTAVLAEHRRRHGIVRAPIED
jgi:hypothetical protein